MTSPAERLTKYLENKSEYVIYRGPAPDGTPTVKKDIESIIKETYRLRELWQKMSQLTLTTTCDKNDLEQKIERALEMSSDPYLSAGEILSRVVNILTN